MTGARRAPLIAGLVVLVTTTAHALAHVGAGSSPGDPGALAAGALLGFVVVAAAHHVVARHPLPAPALILLLLLGQAAVHGCHELAAAQLVPAVQHDPLALHDHHHGAVDLAASSSTAAWLMVCLHGWAAAAHIVLVCGGQRCVRAARVVLLRVITVGALLGHRRMPDPTGTPGRAFPSEAGVPSPAPTRWLLGAGGLARRGPPAVTVAG